MESFTRRCAAALAAFRDHLLRYRKRWALTAATVLILSAAAYGMFVAPPADFAPTTLRVATGMSVPAIADELASAHVIAHPLVLRALLRLSGQSGAVKTGPYAFTRPENAFMIAYRLVTGAYGLPPVRLTFVEGITTREEAQIVASSSLDVSAADFLAAAQTREGYLFPDTYLFPPSADAASVVAAMEKNFNAKIAPLLPDITASGHSLSDIVTMASLVQKEARTSAAQKMVAGILWNRIKDRMPLQVDAVFGYIFDKPTYSPTYADLKVNSPYNTYTHLGLPPGPICNPGASALEAAVHPAQTKYLYYLTDKNGVMHYATTYAGHLANERRYL